MGRENPEISIIMGSQSDWSVMAEASAILQELSIAHEAKIISAHRTPDRMSEFAKSAALNGIKVIIAGAGMAAHLAGAVAAHSTSPVLGVPAANSSLNVKVRKGEGGTRAERGKAALCRSEAKSAGTF